jgi:hypothetical protein
MSNNIESMAILIGINYVKSPSSRLRGCITDVNNMAHFLKETLNYDVVDVYTDVKDETKTRFNAIINSLLRLAMNSHRYKLKNAWIHFSGHGCSIPDESGDEKNYLDECIVPSDYEKKGVISDDVLKQILCKFYKETNVTCIFDCCHSGTIGDLTYNYNTDEHVPTLENTTSICSAKVTMISGCMDCQTSADAYNVQGLRRFSGAMTSCLLEVLKTEDLTFNVVKKLRYVLKEKNFEQIPQLSTSYIVNKHTTFC